MQKSYKIRKIEETTIKNSKRKEDFMLIIFFESNIVIHSSFNCDEINGKNRDWANATI